MCIPNKDITEIYTLMNFIPFIEFPVCPIKPWNVAMAYYNGYVQYFMLFFKLFPFRILSRIQRWFSSHSFIGHFFFL